MGDVTPEGGVALREAFFDANGQPCQAGEAVTGEIEVERPDGTWERTYVTG